ncbi:MAG: carbonic anhydrase [Cyanobacteriota bacterium]|jgi:carbonic anhydrase
MSTYRSSLRSLCPGCRSRRSALKLLGAGLLLSPLLPANITAQASPRQAQALILSCIDFRFIQPEQGFLTQKLDGPYDWVSLAGAALALTGFPHPADAEAFWDQLDLSCRLHQIQTVIILDHQDCGAYASRIDPQLSRDPHREYETHRRYLRQARGEIQRRYPELRVELYFVTLESEFRSVF